MEDADIDDEWTLINYNQIAIERAYFVMVLISDDNSDRGAHSWKDISLFGEENVSDIWQLSIWSNALTRSNNIDCSLLAHLFLSYRPM